MCQQSAPRPPTPLQTPLQTSLATAATDADPTAPDPIDPGPGDPGPGDPGPGDPRPGDPGPVGGLAVVGLPLVGFANPTPTTTATAAGTGAAATAAIGAGTALSEAVREASRGGAARTGSGHPGAPVAVGGGTEPVDCAVSTPWSPAEMTLLTALPAPAHDLEDQVWCELEVGHRGLHYGLGQISGPDWWWLRWREPADTPDGQFDGAGPKEPEPEEAGPEEAGSKEAGSEEAGCGGAGRREFVCVEFCGDVGAGGVECSLPVGHVGVHGHRLRPD